MNENGVFFNFEELRSNGTNEYVCWIDMMGTKNAYSISPNKASIFMAKFHVAILEATQTFIGKIHLYPVMDGIYITANKLDVMISVLQSILEFLANTFVHSNDPSKQFLVKGGLAFGTVWHGYKITGKSSRIFDSTQENKKYKEKILLGNPLAVANSVEKLAPPFCVYLDKSVGLSKGEYSQVHKKWLLWDMNKINGGKDNFVAQMENYFTYAKDNSYFLEYKEEEIRRHKKLFQELIFQIDNYKFNKEA